MSYFLHYISIGLFYFSMFYPKYKQDNPSNDFLHSIFFLYLLSVLSLTVLPLPERIFFQKVDLFTMINLFPFRDVYYGYLFAKREILLNIIMMVPFGFLLPLLTRFKAVKTIILSFFFSFTIESTQLLASLLSPDYYRIVDITDLITNTVGGAIGYCLFSAWKHFFPSSHQPKS